VHLGSVFAVLKILWNGITHPQRVAIAIATNLEIAVQPLIWLEFDQIRGAVFKNDWVRNAGNTVGN